MKSESRCSALAIATIVQYQRHLSPILSKRINCKFHPTCSNYAILSIQKYGLANGLVKAYKRFLKCRPDNFDSYIDYP